VNQFSGMAIAADSVMLAFQGKLLGRAAEICGGWNALCVRLGVEGHSVRLWMEGKARLPERVFLKAADIVLEDDIARAAQDRRAAPRIAALPPESEPAGQNAR
jgi:hypothetical protein